MYSKDTVRVLMKNIIFRAGHCGACCNPHTGMVSQEDPE